MTRREPGHRSNELEALWNVPDDLSWIRQQITKRARPLILGREDALDHRVTPRQTYASSSANELSRLALYQDTAILLPT